MSETSSDAELSCGWTIISNEGSDIETLGSEAVGEYGAEFLERPASEESQPLESRGSASAGTNLALHVEENAANSLDDALGEQPGDETLQGPETADGASVGVFSSSDHSDIVTLRDLEEGQPAEEEEEEEAAAATSTEELYLGTSSSSHYTFTASDIAFLAQHPAATSSSSSEDEVVRSSSPIVRRRRVRKNTASAVTDPEEEEEVLPESRCGDEEVKEEQQQQQADGVEVRLDAAHEGREQGRGGSALNKCVLLAIIIAVGMGFGHFYGTVQTEKRQKSRGIENADVRELLKQHVRDQHLTKQGSDFGQDDLNEQQIIHLLSEVIDRVMQENQELKAEHVRIQVQRDDLEELLKQAKEDRTNIMSQQQSLTDDNARLRSSLERQETSLTVLQEELRTLRSEIQDLEARGAEADSLLSENQRLKEQMEEEQQMIRDFHVQREDMTGELHMLRRKLETEREVTEELRGELSVLRSHVSESGKDGGTEAEDLERRLMELEKRLSFEQQRSDLWERLYVETKEETAKGDRESKTKRAKQGMAGKVKETFDAVKNSTKEFVHHHKEQIKKAKEAVKENLRKFSDSVKSTFRHFKDSASTFINKARGFYNKCDKTNTGEPWRRRTQKPQHRTASSQNDRNTRKSAGKVLEDQDEGTQRSSVKRCSGVFDCAYQESMSLFNKAAEPIRADEFNLLLQSYLQQEVGHFYHWSELGTFIDGFFHDGLFIHDRMLFTDFVSRVENYLAGMHEYHGLDDDVFGDLDDYIYRHFFGEGYTKSYGPRGPFQGPDPGSKEHWRARPQQRKQPRGRSRPQCARRWSRSGRSAGTHMADVKIELGPMPFDPKY
uniref:Cell cycle progression protein 1 n=1 Tax=Fundulus heteroclitus TaxID=8078 RepID=A0A3Q2PVP7_FUNHE